MVTQIIKIGLFLNFDCSLLPCFTAHLYLKSFILNLAYARAISKVTCIGLTGSGLLGLSKGVSLRRDLLQPTVQASRGRPHPSPHRRLHLRQDRVQLPQATVRAHSLREHLYGLSTPCRRCNFFCRHHVLGDRLF